MAIAVNNPTVASGFWGNVAPPSTYHRNTTERALSMVLAKPANRGFRKVMRALNGVAPGAAVTDTYQRISSYTGFSPVSGGGLRTLETVTGPYNRTTTAADVTYLNANVYDAVANVQTYPTDLSGNGGGGKVQR